MMTECIDLNLRLPPYLCKSNNAEIILVFPNVHFGSFAEMMLNIYAITKLWAQLVCIHVSNDFSRSRR